MEHFKVLNAINVNKHSEKKKNLTYLSWSWAWAEVKKVYPDAVYKILKFDNFPYICDTDTGYMCFTEVTIDGITHEMWLPVMDGANKAMKVKSYKYTTKYGDKEVQAASMFDINKTIMRCLTKNLAMFGLGLYIYAGEDIPEILPEELTATHERFLAGVKAVKDGNIKQQAAITYLKKDFVISEEVVNEFKTLTK